MNDPLAVSVRLGLAGWLREGLRAAFFLAPRTRGLAPSPRELLLLALLATAVELVLARLEVPGPAHFNLRGWLAPWWTVGAIVLLLWALLSSGGDTPRERGGLASWFALWLVAAIPVGIVSQGLGIAQAWELLPAALEESEAFAWGSYFGLWAWTLAIAMRLGRHFGLGRMRVGALGTGLALILGLSAWQFPDRAWYAPPAYAQAPRLVLSEETFERQQQLLQAATAGLAPQRAGVIDVYGLVFAPSASEDVFMRESAMVADVLAQRFDAQGRVLQLVNHPQTADALPWATPRTLRRAIDAIAQRMDRGQDVLVVYMTSHGARDFKLAATHPPLQVDPVSPGELRTMLDEAGIRYRVIAISACYAGGWVGPLAGDSTLVMTAADADNTSYGCGALSELTFFGRAVFDEQLRQTHSFEQAFAAAVPVIRQREVDARKPDGFSNPQISVGAGIRAPLKALEQRLATP